MKFGYEWAIKAQRKISSTGSGAELLSTTLLGHLLCALRMEQTT